MYDLAAERSAAAAVDRSIPFIDTHHHLWELDRFRYDWLRSPRQDDPLGDYRAICVDWGPQRFFREFYAQNVIKSVHVEADQSGPDPVAETAWLEQVANTFGMPNGLVVMCDIGQPGAEAQLERHLAASGRVRGIRLRDHPDTAARERFHVGYRALSRLGLTYEFDASPGSFAGALALAAAHPQVPMVLTHTGFPLRRDPDYQRYWRTELDRLARAPNVSCKVSGLATVDHQWTVDSLREWVLGCIDAFGVERVMFATNWPVETLFAPYMEQVDAWRRILADAGFPHADQSLMLHGNAERTYRI